MARTTMEKKTTYSVILKPSVRDGVNALAEKAGSSFSNYVELVLQEHLRSGERYKMQLAATDEEK